ncbi:YaaR family protein [Fusibacter bizertensis]
MKVEKSSKSSKTSVINKGGIVKTEEKPKISFTEILAIKDYDQQKQELQKALDEIDKKGQDLVENRTVENLYAYKDLIKSFIEETVMKGLEIKERRGFSRSGRTKVMRTVAEVDAKLLELTNLILKREHKEINVLKKVGEIQGLLVNIVI